MQDFQSMSTFACAESTINRDLVLL